MRIPRDTIKVEETTEGFVARTLLLDGPVGCGGSEKEAVANLGWAVRAHLKLAHAAGCEVPEAFRMPAWRRVLLVALFALFAVALPIAAVHLWALLGK